ncbi:Dynein axonemal assembly factor 6 [Pseudolycoriella hygida]|uniref:Dynein axonemal assembly factor 6 n=1 Tax=Pseudolycoriella hygida TaxID=35572 RepID=A0A9Q0NF16_9DIPT|nr:Dynein axonemal assembly factor 6 [Pseudolycoriella hygida]
MSFFGDVNTIKLLTNLLKPPDESSDSEDEINVASSSVSKLGPGDIHNKGRTNVKEQNERINTYEPQKAKQCPTSIEEWEELQLKTDFDALDTRKRPDYKVSYKQDVKTEDEFLQLSNKSTATSSCDEIVIHITMPDETVSIDGMKLSVSRNDIDLETPVYRLKLPLMQPINPDMGKASWDNEKKILTLRLKMDREFDYVNF